jgi:uncharacterized protein with HEPN domain
MRLFCRRILEYTEHMTLKQFTADRRTFDAVVRNLEITGEAAKHVPADIKDRHPDVEWRGVTAFRDVAAHAYSYIDEEVVWNIIRTSVPTLLEQVEHILAVEFPDE